MPSSLHVSRECTVNYNNNIIIIIIMFFFPTRYIRAKELFTVSHSASVRTNNIYHRGDGDDDQSIWFRFRALLQVPDFVNITESKSACSSPQKLTDWNNSSLRRRRQLSAIVWYGVLLLEISRARGV
jgi:hypothetical protein